jgi:hypothetical protein
MFTVLIFIKRAGSSVAVTLLSILKPEPHYFYSVSQFSICADYNNQKVGAIARATIFFHGDGAA